RREPPRTPTGPRYLVRGPSLIFILRGAPRRGAWATAQKNTAGNGPGILHRLNSGPETGPSLVSWGPPPWANAQLRRHSMARLLVSLTVLLLTSTAASADLVVRQKVDGTGLAAMAQGTTTVSIKGLK